MRRRASAPGKKTATGAYQTGPPYEQIVRRNLGLPSPFALVRTQSDPPNDSTGIGLFPSNLVASMFGFQRNDAYFKTEPVAREAPKVSFA